MHRCKSEGRRRVDVGKIAQISSRRNTGKQRESRRACKRRSDDGWKPYGQVRASTVSQERDEVYAALQYAAGFHCLVEEWKDCEELEPKPKEKWTFVNKKRKQESIEQSGVRQHTITDVYM